MLLLRGLSARELLGVKLRTSSLLIESLSLTKILLPTSPATEVPDFSRQTTFTTFQRFRAVSK